MSKSTRGSRCLRSATHITPETGGDPEPSNVILIETEALAAARREYGANLGSGEHRRNITTRNVTLNHLVDEQFHIGEVVVEGLELCESCGYMQLLADQSGTAEALTHRCVALRVRGHEATHQEVAHGSNLGEAQYSASFSWIIAFEYCFVS